MSTIQRTIAAVCCTIALCASNVGAQAADTTTKIRLNGFVDTYYAYDVTRPADGERRYTTQPVRHDEANVNLAWLGVTVTRPKVRARVALQAGTSVQANYAAEPRAGATSGPEVSRFIQEGVVGVKLADHLWIDAGIYFSYLGLEGWSSADNPTYTRSLVADYSPYYLSGAKLTWSPTPKLTAQVHLTNGWQNIAENNRSKAVGARVDYAVTPALTVSYGNFFGNERPTGSTGVLRSFHQVMAKGTVSSGTQWQAQLDAGRQGRADWYGLVAIARHPLTPRVAFTARVERYADPDQVIITTSAPTGFVANGVSAGLDVTIDTDVHWRSELRTIHAESPLYPRAVGTPTRTNGVLVTSLSVGF